MGIREHRKKIKNLRLNILSYDVNEEVLKEIYGYMKMKNIISFEYYKRSWEESFWTHHKHKDLLCKIFWFDYDWYHISFNRYVCKGYNWDKIYPPSKKSIKRMQKWYKKENIRLKKLDNEYARNNKKPQKKTKEEVGKINSK